MTKKSKISTFQMKSRIAICKLKDKHEKVIRFLSTVEYKDNTNRVSTIECLYSPD